MTLTNIEDLTMLSEDDPLPIKIYLRGIMESPYVEIYGLIIGLVIYRDSYRDTVCDSYRLLPIGEFNKIYFNYFKP